MNKREETFVQAVWDFYAAEGRHTLPWRTTDNPYRILVSEIMLQQTQVDRVIPKYRSFLRAFPTVRVLASASLGDVLREWQGLGYNRRAKMLHAAAGVIVKEHKGRFPQTYEALRSLPGVGPYTAGAISAFAFRIPIPIIETNIRTVFIHHFFRHTDDVQDTDILRLVERTLPTEQVHAWYGALMDYGTYLKKTEGNPNRRSAHYVVQSAFQGSDRHIRGIILKALTQKPSSEKELVALSAVEKERVIGQLGKLLKEGMIVKKRTRYTLPDT